MYLINQLKSKFHLQLNNAMMLKPMNIVLYLLYNIVLSLIIILIFIQFQQMFIFLE